MTKQLLRAMAPYLAASSLVASGLGCSSSSDPSGEQSAAGAAAQAGIASGGQSAGTAGGKPGAGGSGGEADSASGAAGASEASSAGAGPATTVGDYALASTGRGNCALDSAGTIHCWGYAPDPWTIPSGPFVELHGSVDFVCALRADHTVACFDAPAPNSISGTADLVPQGKVQPLSLSLSRGSVCGVDDADTAFCISKWGGVNMPPDGIAQISAGFSFACGIGAEGKLACWGGSGGPDGDACTIPATRQLAAPNGSYTAIASSYYSSCAIGKDGAVACWGAGKPADDPAALCAGNRYNFGQATPAAGSFRSLSLGNNHACGIKTNGTIACWGAGTTVATDCPGTDDECGQSKPPTGSFIQVSVGTRHSCAMTAERKIQCWGYPGADMGDGRLVPPDEFQ